MEEYSCSQAVISSFDRRGRFLKRKEWGEVTWKMRFIQGDNCFHLALQSKTKQEVFISKKILVSDNIDSLHCLAIEIPEFRSVVELFGESHILLCILKLLRHETCKPGNKTIEKEKCPEKHNLKQCRECDKENSSAAENGAINSEESSNKKRMQLMKKLKSPCKSGLTPQKKKDCVRDTSFTPIPINQSQKCFFLSNEAADVNQSGAEEKSQQLNLTETQREVLTKSKKGCNVFVTGGAGTGKTFILKCIQAELSKIHGIQSVFVTATTGIAAVNISGTTVHQFAGIRPGDSASKVHKNQAAVRRWKMARVLIVDEISMMSPGTLELLNIVAQEARGSASMMGGVQVIFVGDFFQLPPVSKSVEAALSQPVDNENSKYCFQSPVWKDLFDKESCFVLNEVHRQKDKKFSSILNEIRWGNCSDEICEAFQHCVKQELDSADGILPTKIFTHRREVDSLNASELEKLSGDSCHYKSRDGGESCYVQLLKSHCPAKQDITLKAGAQVMLLKCIDSQSGLVNGSRGVVVGFTKAAKRPVVRFLGGIVRQVHPEEFSISVGGRVVAQRFQIPLDLAWGMSVHKSQGISVEKAVLCINNAFEYGQAYVALSRVKSIQGLSISHSLKPSHIKTHPQVKQFYKDLISVKQKKENIEENLKTLSST